MRIQNKHESEMAEGDLTPMIDMTFQLIAFFMVLINFSQAEQSEQIQLPNSALARPAEVPLEHPITLQLTKDGQVIMGGQQAPIEALLPLLQKEVTVLDLINRPIADATIIIRAHKDAPGGKVQDLIKICQDQKFEKFALRAKEDVNAPARKE